MKLRSKLADDAAAQGFTDQNDIFLRRDLANRITATFLQLEHGSVSVLDGRWGVGKTTFAKQWMIDLKTKNIAAIYFDAFANDYLESPFQAIAGAIIEAAMDAGRTNSPAYKDFLTKAAAVGKTVASTATKIGIKAATFGLIGTSEIDSLSDIKDTIADSLGDFSHKQVEDLLEKQAKEKQNFSALKHSLENLPMLLRPSLPDGKSDHAPCLIFIIDELDRCRPDFALGILETLKHFFRTDYLHFVLVTNLAQIEGAVANRYGGGCSPREYLQKFYDFIVNMDVPYEQHGPTGIEIFVRNIVGELIPGNNHEIVDTLISVSKAYRLSLRQIQSLATNVAISFLAYQERELRINFLISFLGLFKTLRPDLYEQARRGALDVNEVANFLRSVSWDNNTDIERVIEIFSYYSFQNIDENDDRWRGFGSQTRRYNIGRLRVIPYLCNSLLERFGAPNPIEN